MLTLKVRFYRFNYADFVFSRFIEGSTIVKEKEHMDREKRFVFTNLVLFGPYEPRIFVVYK